MGSTQSVHAQRMCCKLFTFNAPPFTIGFTKNGNGMPLTRENDFDDAAETKVERESETEEPRASHLWCCGGFSGSTRGFSVGGLIISSSPLSSFACNYASWNFTATWEAVARSAFPSDQPVNRIRESCCPPKTIVHRKLLQAKTTYADGGMLLD